MPNSMMWFILAFVAFDLLVIAVVVPLVVRNAWRGVTEPYPAVDPKPDAVHRRFQSFRFGVVNMGGSVHVSADDDYLHLGPAGLMRWFRLDSASIPWSAITLERKRRRGATVRINGKQVSGPAWCLELANPESLDA